MPRKEANPFDQPAHAETTTPERRLIVLGMWTREMRARGESVSTEWARESYAAASRLKRRQTYNVTAIALGQEPGKNVLAITRRFADRTPLTPVKGCPVMEGEAESPELEDRIRVWRRAVTYQWLLLGRKIEERLKSNTPIDDAWVDAETRAAEEGTPESAQDRARRELEALGVEGIELEDCPIAVVEIDENGPRHALPAGVRWYPTSRLTALRAEKGHLVVCGPGHGAAMRSGTGSGWAIRLGTGHGDAVRKDTGHGGALRAGPGHGHARRMDTGDGDAVRIGSGAGHAEHTSLGDGDAIRDGDGPGEAYGGRTARRSGAGPGCSRGEIHAAVREGSGPGTAMIRKAARTVLRTGSGPGDAFAASDGKAVAANRSSGPGDAHNIAPTGDALRDGTGSGDAIVVNDGGGDAVRSGSGSGNAIRRYRNHGAGAAGHGVRLDEGVGDAIFESNPKLGGIVHPRSTGEINSLGSRAEEPAEGETAWNVRATRQAKADAVRRHGPPRRKETRTATVRIVADGTWRGGKREGIFWEPETQALVLDSDNDVSLHVTGRGHANVIRRGRGTGDVIRSGKGYGDVTHEGAGDGSAIHTDDSLGNATRTGSGRGHAWNNRNAMGNARVGEDAEGHAVNVSWEPGDAINESSADGYATRAGRGPGNAVRHGSGAGHAQRTGEGEGDAIRDGAGNGNAPRTGLGMGRAHNKAAGTGHAWHNSPASGDALRDGAGDGHAARLTPGSGNAERTGTGRGDAVVHADTRGAAVHGSSGEGVAGVIGEGCGPVRECTLERSV